MPSQFEEAMLSDLKVLEARSLQQTITDPGSAQTLTPHPQAVFNICNMTSAGAEARTLDDPAFVGQVLILVAADQGDGDITITHDDTFDGTNNTATFGDDGDSIVLLAAGTTAATWRSIANAGVALSDV
jgi:FlaG/FlaF family flagellin (archaellin)